MPRLTPAQLDAILALQLTVAWAGEAAGEPPRLGWWSSDLVDPLGGADLFQRLVPRTAAWAALGLVRRVAQRVDEEARSKLSAGDAVWTLFHFGFHVDEQLDGRIAHHRQHQHVPADLLGPRFRVGTAWSKDALLRELSALGRPSVEITPAGRRLTQRCGSAAEAAPLLAAALAPLVDTYPMPYLEMPYLEMPTLDLPNLEATA